jgi:hypothetical protein
MPKIVAFALEVFLCSGGNLTPFSIAKLDIILQSTKLERKKRQKSLLIISEIVLPLQHHSAGIGYVSMLTL